MIGCFLAEALGGKTPISVADLPPPLSLRFNRSIHFSRFRFLLDPFFLINPFRAIFYIKGQHLSEKKKVRERVFVFFLTTFFFLKKTEKKKGFGRGPFFAIPRV